MIKKRGKNRMSGHLCNGCNSDDRVEEFSIGSTGSTISIRLCNKCRLEFINIMSACTEVDSNKDKSGIGDAKSVVDKEGDNNDQI